MSKNNSILSFIIGAAVGSAVTWFISKQEYEKRINEEISELRNKSPKTRGTKAQNDNDDEKTEPDRCASDDTDDDIMAQAKKIAQDNKYVNYATAVPDKEAGNKQLADKPYTILPEEFGELDDYEKISLSYYADGIVADEDDEVIDDIAGTIGEESLRMFGQYEDDSVYVRNDALKYDYEILLDTRRFHDIKRANS